MRLEISSFKRVVVLTGAGVSAESGIRTFRDSDGLWEKYRIEEVATPEAFERDPLLVWRFYSMRRQNAADARPNPAHVALARYARLAAKRGQRYTLITQNVDDLHERANRELNESGVQPEPLAMHGTLPQSRCLACDKTYFDPTSWFREDGAPEARVLEAFTQAPTSRLEIVSPQKTPRSPEGLPLSACCHEPLRPNIVWFGEVPLFMAEIEAVLSDCDLFVTIGTSGAVYPAAGFLETAKIAGATTACLNKEQLPQHTVVDLFVEGPATHSVPGFFN